MSDKTELIAAAQINAFVGPPAGIEFNSNDGFKTATRSSEGVYTLELTHHHGVKKLVVNATQLRNSNGMISAVVLNETTIQINTFDASGVAEDSPFSITVHRVRD